MKHNTNDVAVKDEWIFGIDLEAYNKGLKNYSVEWTQDKIERHIHIKVIGELTYYRTICAFDLQGKRKPGFEKVKQ